MGGRINAWRIAFVVGGGLTCVLLLFVLSNSQNQGFAVSYTHNVNDPGIAKSARFGAAWWAHLLRIIGLVAVFVLAVMRYVRIQNRILYAGHVISAILFLIATGFLIVMQAFAIGTCNHSASSPCTDPRFCCVYAPVVPAVEFVDGCPLLIRGCLPVVAVDDLGWNPVFTWDFVLTLVGAVVGVYHLTVGICLTASGDEELSAKADIVPAAPLVRRPAMVSASGELAPQLRPSYSQLPSLQAQTYSFSTQRQH